MGIGVNIFLHRYPAMKRFLIEIQTEPLSSRLMVMLILAFPLMAFALSLSHLVTGLKLRFYVIEAIELTEFLVVAMLILAAGRDLSRYHLDRISLICILLFPGLLSPVPAEAPAWFMVLSMGLPLALAVGLFRRLRAIRGFGDGGLVDLIKYLFLGTLLAAVFILITTRFHYPYRDLVWAIWREGPLSVLDTFSISMSTAAAIEEPIYRGFLLGHLIHDRGWKPRNALLAQTLVFWIPHVYYLDDPFGFWLGIPLFGLINGLVTLMTGNIAPSMFAHAIYNTVLTIVNTAASG